MPRNEGPSAVGRRSVWPLQVRAVVLGGSLTGDHRRDFHENHLLGMCQIHAVDDQTARDAAGLRTATGRAAEISAVDAIVVAFAIGSQDAIVLTSDPTDLADLAETGRSP